DQHRRRSPALRLPRPGDRPPRRPRRRHLDGRQGPGVGGAPAPAAGARARRRARTVPGAGRRRPRPPGRAPSRPRPPPRALVPAARLGRPRPLAPRRRAGSPRPLRGDPRRRSAPSARRRAGWMSGVVYLVGAGPGDPELITVRGLACLRRADVVVYDRLIDPRLLDEIPPAARRVYAGKRPGRQALRQEEIDALLVRHARAGRTVVRLKGGDPFVLRPGGEEALACAAAGGGPGGAPGGSAGNAR